MLKKLIWLSSLLLLASYFHTTYPKSVASQMFSAVKACDLKALKARLAEKKADINVKDTYGDTLLHKAVEQGEEKVVVFLLSKGAQVDIKNNVENTPLYVAYEKGNKALIKLLVDKGADVNIKDKFFGNTLLHEFCKGARSDAKEMITFLLAKGADINSTNKTGDTPLCIAYDCSKKEILVLLIEKGADLNKKDKWGNALLHKLVESSKADAKEMIIFLLNKGADINSTNDAGDTPLNVAYDNDKKELFTLLIEKGADLNKKDKWGNTISHKLVESTDKDALEMMELVLGKGANANVTNEMGHSPSSIAYDNANMPMLTLLIQRGVGVKDKDKYSEETLLHKIAKKPRKDALEIIELLLQAGADINSKTHIGETPLMVAFTESNREIFDFLLEKGADANMQDSFGETLLHRLAEGSRNDALEMIELLLAKGADANIKNRIGDNPYNVASKKNKKEIIALLMKKGNIKEVSDRDKYLKKLKELPVSEDVKKDLKRDIDKLQGGGQLSADKEIIRDYLELVFSLPWNKDTEEKLDIAYAKKVLDEEHYGLKKVKERILDIIAVRKLKKDNKAPILCFVGPPGVGKTSIAKSIAKCLGRKYVKVALGGVHDESEIRGHRRTYVGAMPGRFIQSMRRIGVTNPVILLDEIDKLGAGGRGNTSAAMLEVLDPNQNKDFQDKYLAMPFDLSKAMFIATANNLGAISGPLRDRMEIIDLAGYTSDEKLNIAKNHLVKNAIKDTGLEKHKIKLSDVILLDVIKSYTLEAGVRELDRVIRKLCAKQARALAEKKKTITFTKKNIETYLGPRIFTEGDAVKQDKVGMVNGLAASTVGGSVTKVEALIFAGSGKLVLTGSLGDVIKESAQAALSYVRAHAKKFGIDSQMFNKYDLHIHLPEGGIKKDGPSAGITLITAITSAFTKREASAKYAMTGEINLSGDVMPIGGVKQKLLAAKRHNIPNVIFPEKNRKDLVEEKKITKGINVIFVSKASDVIQRVLPGLI